MRLWCHSCARARAAQASNYKAYEMVDYYAPAFDAFDAYTPEGEQQLVEWYDSREKREQRATEPVVVEAYSTAAMVRYYLR